jgi:hypothetical protein
LKQACQRDKTKSHSALAKSTVPPSAEPSPQLRLVIRNGTTYAKDLDIA